MSKQYQAHGTPSTPSDTAAAEALPPAAAVSPDPYPWDKEKAEADARADTTAIRRAITESVAYRKRAKIPQGVVGDRTGTSQTAVSNLEHGTDYLTSSLFRHVRALGGTVEIKLTFPPLPEPPKNTRRRAATVTRTEALARVRRTGLASGTVETRWLASAVQGRLLARDIPLDDNARLAGLVARHVLVPGNHPDGPDTYDVGTALAAALAETDD